jgi:3-oxoacyl-[acyl-carrier-protein] synthase-1
VEKKGGYRIKMNYPVYILADSVVSPLGNTTKENMEKLYNMESSIESESHPQMGKIFASTFNVGKYFPIQHPSESFTKIERLFIYSIEQAIASLNIPLEQTNVLFVFASTKGNIDFLGDTTFDSNRLRIGIMAKYIAEYFGNKNKSIVVSNACISGLQAIQYGCQALQSQKYTHVIVTGADCVSEFVLSGFHSFQALSPFPCTPFDKNRSGVSLGEGCGTLILSCKQKTGKNIEICSVVSSNDANHLSGPSRTGEGLASAIQGAIIDAGISDIDIDVISAHGTATVYNDEMESLAFKTTGVANVPVYSVKGNIGHCLGASGIIETIVLANSMLADRLVPSIGFKETGTTVALNVIAKSMHKNLNIGLKTASGFGGGNTALILKKQK